MKKRIIGLKVLPGEPTNGSGRICVHLYVPDPKGLVTEQGVRSITNSKFVTEPTKGRLACDPKRLVAPVESKGVISVTMRTDDPRAVTCPHCQKSDVYKQMSSIIKSREQA